MTHLRISQDSKTNLAETSMSHKDSKIIFSDDLKQILEMTPQLIWVHKSEQNYCNSAMRNYFGHPTHDLQVLDALKAIHPKDAEYIYTFWNDAKKTGLSFEKECRIKDANGLYQWFLLIAKSTKNSENQLDWFVSCSNIHNSAIALRETTEALNTNTSMLDASVDCIKVITPEGHVSHMNRSGCNALLGQDRVDKFGMEWLSLLPPEAKKEGRKAIKKAAHGKNARFAGKSTAGGKIMYWDNILTPVLNDKNQTTRILSVSRDITLQRLAEQKLRLASETDELTSLMNRRALKKRIYKTLKHAKTKDLSFAVMIIDLDHFKHINDTLGHHAGDHLLKVLSKRLLKKLPENTYISRLGGDEFAVVVENVRNLSDLSNTSKVILKQIQLPIKYKGKILSAGMSIGCSLFPKDAQDITHLLKYADTALNDLKSQGRGGFKFYDSKMMKDVHLKAQQLFTARQIIRNHNIEPFYQAKVNLETLQLVGFEALLRWKDEKGCIQFPSTIADAFNDYDLASQISEIIQTQVFQDLSTWIELGLNVVPIAINASPVEFMRDDYAELILKRLEKYKIPHKLIEVEITEHVLESRGSEYVIRALTKLKNAGIRIALDDFGTGHSSMAHLTDYPVDCLKIDYNFVHRLNKEKSVSAIVEGITKLGPILSLDVIAEGIETKEQLENLKSFGCCVGQGFLFSKAVPENLAKDMLTNNMFL